MALRWLPSPGANYYSVYRTTLYENGVGGTYPLRTILLDDGIAQATCVDTSPTDGKIYSYHVKATGVGGTSGASAEKTVVPLPRPPASRPASCAGSWIKSRQGDEILLKWSPVPGAVGYVIYRSTRSDGQFHWPKDFLTTVVETTYTDKNDEKKGAKKPAEKRRQNPDDKPRLLLPDHRRQCRRHLTGGNHPRRGEVTSHSPVYRSECDR